MLVGFVGCGLIGTSLIDLCLSTAGIDGIVGIETNPSYLAVLRDRFPAQKFTPDLDQAKSCDFVFVCTSTASVPSIVLKLKDLCDEHTIIVDTASVKTPVVTAVRDADASFDRFVPGHPMAGGRAAGPEQAGGNLLAGKPFLLTPYEATSREALRKTCDLLGKLGFKVQVTQHASHDQMVALTSHLTHLFAFAIVKRLFDLESASPAGTAYGPVDVTSFAGRSFLDMAHFAGANPEMWSEIFAVNHDAVASEITAVGTLMTDLLAVGHGEQSAKLAGILGEIRSKQQNMEKSHEDKEQR